MKSKKITIEKWIQLEYEDDITYECLINCMFNKIINFCSKKNIYLSLPVEDFKYQFVNYLFKYSKAKDKNY